MNKRYLLSLAALSSAAFLNGSAVAADASTTVTQMQNNPAPVGAPSETLPAGPASVGGSQRMDNTNPVPLDSWVDNYAATHEGRITRQEFLDQMGRRWDTLDAQGRGYLTPDQAREIYTFTPHPGSVPPESSATTGTNRVPGYMGPGSAKGQ